MTYQQHLAKDKKLKALLSNAPEHKLIKKKNIPIYLVSSIMSQQLNTKVADIIYNRFIDLFGKEPSVEEILKMSFEKLRGIGLSNAKVGYVKNVAQFAVDQGMDFKLLNKMSNEEVIAYLTQIKGVGRWTVEMLLMFALGREDVFAIDDLGIQNAMANLYNLNKTDKKSLKADMLRIAEKWSPFRTYACIHLWRWKDNAPTPNKKAKKTT